MDSISVLTHAFATGKQLIEQCEMVEHCHSESIRIALRTAWALSHLDDGSEFSGESWYNASLLDLQEVFNRARDLIDRCTKPTNIFQKAGATMRANKSREGLVRVEKDLEKIMTTLHVPMMVGLMKAVKKISVWERGGGVGGVDAEGLTQAVRKGIRQELDAFTTNGVSIGTIIQDSLSKLQELGFLAGDDILTGEQKEARGSSKGVGKLIVRLGRVRFDQLDEGTFLGEGTFGTVLSGTYKGEKVAIKKIRTEMRRNPAVLKGFRYVCSLCFFLQL